MLSEAWVNSSSVPRSVGTVNVASKFFFVSTVPFCVSSPNFFGIVEETWYSRAEFRPRMFRLSASVISGYPHLRCSASGIWNRQNASYCHCGEPYHSESEPNTTRFDPMFWRSWPMMCAHTEGKGMIVDANV